MTIETVEKTAEERATEIAKKTLDALNAKKAVASGEPKGASEGVEPKADNKQKTEELVKKAQEQAEKNADQKQKEAQQVGDKVERRKEEIQKEINALIAQRESLKKEVQDTGVISKEIAELRLKVSELEKSKVSEKPIEVLQKEAEAEQVKRYLEEDKSKPREQRREMNDEELSAWLTEDYLSAQKWLTEQTLRRREERNAYISKVNEERSSRSEKELKERQAASAQRVKSKFPDMVLAEDEYNTLIKNGKSANEARELVSTNYPFYNALVELYAKEEQSAQRENRKNKYMSADNGPELLAQEAHDSVKSLPKGRLYTEEEVEELLKTRKTTPPVSISSSRPSNVGSSDDDEISPELKDVLKKSKMTYEQYKAAVKRRESIPGA